MKMKRNNWWAAAVSVCLGLGLAGCAVPSALMYKFMGPPAIPPKYVFPQKPVLLLVENTHSGSVAIPEADELSKVVYDELQEHKVAPLIDPAKVTELRDRDGAAFSKMTISDIGRNLGAAQVLYLQVDQLDIDVPQGSDVVKVKIAIEAKAIDVPTAQTVWPMSGETEPYKYESRPERVEIGMTRAALSHQVLRESGEEIARWFYAFKPETMREENQDLRLR
jgi:hypothetical protein